MSTIARLKIKEIDRDLRKQWNMVSNSTVHVKSDLFLNIISIIFHKKPTIVGQFERCELIWVLHDCEKLVS